MGCGCGKARKQSARSSSGSALPVERGVQRSKINFVVTVGDEESTFFTIRQARVFAELHGVKVETRRMSL
jgi:hypothetical protein